MKKISLLTVNDLYDAKYHLNVFCIKQTKIIKDDKEKTLLPIPLIGVDEFKKKLIIFPSTTVNTFYGKFEEKPEYDISIGADIILDEENDKIIIEVDFQKVLKTRYPNDKLRFDKCFKEQYEFIHEKYSTEDIQNYIEPILKRKKEEALKKYC